MKRYNVSLPQVGLIAATRGMAGAGLGLLLAERIPRPRRVAVGWTLFAVGALTTIPLVLHLMKGRNRSLDADGVSEPTMPEREPIGAEL